MIPKIQTTLKKKKLLMCMELDYFQTQIEQPSMSRLDVWNQSKSNMFAMANDFKEDRRVQRALRIWSANATEAIDDPRYGDELFDALFCAHHKMKSKTPHFYFKHVRVEQSPPRFIYEHCILRKDMCGHKKWTKVKNITFDGTTHEFRVKNEEYGYPVTVI